MMTRFFAFLLCAGFTLHLNAQLIINELSNGPTGSGSKEYVELVVTGNPVCGSPNTVDIRGWIIDDNNSWHATGAGTGIAAGHIKFDSIAPWANVKIGSIILIYNDADMNTATAALMPDPSDANGDCRYIVPASSAVLLKNTNLPLGGGSMTTYAVPGTTYSTTGNWSVAGLANSGDAFHTVSPANYAVPYHTMGYGNNTTVIDIYFAGVGDGLVYSMLNTVDNDPFNQANYTAASASTNETPGAPNNPANAAWIAGMTNNCLPLTITTDTLAITLCPGQSVIINGQTVTTAGSYNDTLPAVAGCDTIRTYNITTPGYSAQSVNVVLCPGQSTTINGQTISAAGTYLDTVPSSVSCDTIVIYTVSVLTYNTQTQNVTLCPSQSITINGQTITAAGTYLDTVPSSGACDTIVTYNVTTSAYNTITQNIGICSGQSIVINGQTVTTSGTYLDTVPSSGSCDTIITYNVLVSNYNISNVNVNLCPGQSVVINGQTVTASGVYADTIPSTGSGCDTIYIYQVTANGYIQQSQNVSLCPGQSVVINSQTVFATGTYTDTVPSSVTCDTVITYNVTANGYNTQTQNISLCTGQSIVINGQTVNTTGTYFDTIPASAGCDTIVTYNVAVNNFINQSANINLCPGQSTVINGQTIITSGTYADTVAATGGGCDTIFTYNVTIQNYNTNTVDTSICNGQSIIINGQTVSTAGTYLDTVSSASACDTIVTYNVTINLYVTSSQNISFCQGDSVVINGVTYTAAGTALDTIVSGNSCDTIVTYNLSVNQTLSSQKNITICLGDTYFAGGTLQNTSGLYRDTLTAVTGCDSIVATNLTVQIPDTTSQNIAICAGDLWQGGPVSNDTVIYMLYPNQNGCDSTVQFNITVDASPVPVLADTLNIDGGQSAVINISGGAAYSWSSNQTGSQITVAPAITTTYYVTVLDVNSCSATDSILVIVTPVPELSIVIPTAFSPNGDGVNNIFDIVNRYQFTIEVFNIYNRWGELVFSDATSGWDGTFRGVAQPIGTYVFYVEAFNTAHTKRFFAKGNVTLVR